MLKTVLPVVFMGNIFSYIQKILPLQTGRYVGYCSCFVLILSGPIVTSHKKLHFICASFTSGSCADLSRRHIESNMNCPIKSWRVYNKYFGLKYPVTLLARPIKRLKLFSIVCRFMATG